MKLGVDFAHPLKVALVGCGRWGTCLAGAVAALPEFDLKWVCDPAVRPPSGNWAPALTDEVARSVDVVIVATPPDQHVLPTLVALRAGKPVFVEKPFAQSLAEVRQIRAAGGDVPVMVGHLLEYHPAYHRLLNWVRASEGGITIDIVRRSPARGIERCPWWTLAPHDLALLTRLFGEPEDLRLAPTREGVQAVLVWPRARAKLSYSTTAAVKNRFWRASSASGDACFDEIEGTFIARGATTERISFSAADPLRDELRHFAKCARREIPALTGIDEAEQGVRLLCLGEQQLRSAADDVWDVPLRGFAGNP